MANISLGYPNRIDEATLTGGSWQATLPLANLQDRVIAHLARSADATTAATKFDLQLPQARSIGAVALVGHNLSVSAKVRIRAASTQADLTSAPAYDSGWGDVWPAGAIPTSLLEWEDDNFWLGTISAEARAAYNTPYVHVLATAALQAWWRVEIDDTINPAGYVHLGRVFIGPLWSPTYNASYGLSQVVDDRTGAEESQGGAEFFDTGSRRRSTAFTLDWLSEEEAYAGMLDMQRLVGVSGEVLCVPDRGDVTNGFRRNMLGRLAKVDPIVEHTYGHHRVNIEIREIL